MDDKSNTAPYGNWDSPITASLIAAKGESFEGLFVDDVRAEVYLIEARPSEGGRNVLVKIDREVHDVFGANWNARSGVNEYGGAPAAAHDGVVYFSNIGDHRVYKIVESQEPHPVTPESPDHRYADFAVHPSLTNLLVCVRDDHSSGPHSVKTTLAVIDTSTSAVTTLVSGADFYATPRFSPDGNFIAWTQRYFPDMPWHGGEILLASITVSHGENGVNSIAVGEPVHVSGERRTVSVAEPTWVTPQKLLFICDKGGYSNPWLFSLASPEQIAAPVSQTLIHEDFDEPAWELGMSSYAVLDEHTALFSAWRHGRAVLYLVDLNTHTFLDLHTPYVRVYSLHKVAKDKVYFVGKSLDQETAVIEVTLSIREPQAAKLGVQYRVIKSKDALFPPSLISPATPIEIKVAPKDSPVHLVYYPPKNPAYVSHLNGELPPAVVDVHGGPTSMEDQGLKWVKHFFTSRGWAWVDLNYGGSSGYGRKYRDRLNGGWGVAEVQDAAEAVRQLGERDLIDASRAVIRGGSAGGFTTLCALASLPDVFAAGAPSYGISDLRKLQEIPHKFESKYNQTLLGGTLEDIPEVWKERSPISKAVNIKAPLLILQGANDPVVPPSQAEDMVKTIQGNGGRVEYVVFDGEGHGWRKEETTRSALEKELAFFEDVLQLRR